MSLGIGGNHLISHRRSGVLLNFYVVLIRTLLMYLHTGHRPGKYEFALLGMAAQHGGDLESLPGHCCVERDVYVNLLTSRQ